MNATKQDIKAIIFAGCSLEYEGISICNLENHLKNAVIKRNSKYQVWSDRHRCYKLYQNLDEAVDKFLSLTSGK